MTIFYCILDISYYVLLVFFYYTVLLIGLDLYFFIFLKMGLVHYALASFLRQEAVNFDCKKWMKNDHTFHLTGASCPWMLFHQQAKWTKEHLGLQGWTKWHQEKGKVAFAHVIIEFHLNCKLKAYLQWFQSANVIKHVYISMWGNHTQTWHMHIFTKIKPVGS